MEDILVSRYSTRNLRSIGAFAAIGVISLTVSATAAPPDSLQSFVQENIDKGYRLLNDNSLTEAQRDHQFRNFMLSLMDTSRIGRFTLGPYANSASPAELAAFETAFAGYAVAVYELRLGEFRDAKIRVTGSSELSADDTVINAELSGPSLPNASDPIQLGFRVRKSAEGHSVITDMEIEGVWLALLERADFTGFLQQHGGSVAALSEHLRSEADQINAETSALTSTAQ